ncbi:MAG: hypothetical protein WAW37_11585 [Syntrophobacteraceae bacterium]
MSIPSKTVKGLQDIRSHSGRAREGAIPHKAYMRLSCLEMEKFRRARERESAMTRVRNIDARCREIDAEKAIILGLMKEEDTPGLARAPEGAGGPGTGRVSGGADGRDPGATRNTGGFKLKY